MFAPAASVMLAPDNKVTLSVNVLAPPTLILPVVLLPMMMLLAPSETRRVAPLNNVAGRDKVPLPVPMPIVAPEVKV